MALFKRRYDDVEDDFESQDNHYVSNTSELTRGGTKNRVAPDGVNPNPLEYMVLEDSGKKVYTTALYANNLPRTDTFAATFSTLFNFPGATTSVHIVPLDAVTSSKMLDKRVVALESEVIAAKKSGDSNRIRKVSDKRAEAEQWARELESGANALYYVDFIFTTAHEELRAMNDWISEFIGKASEKNIELANSYSVVPEVYTSAGPYNRIFQFSYGPFHPNIIKQFVMDRNSLANIFNHTSFHFSHENGIFLGRELHTGLPMYHDIFDRSHNGYNAIICGMTGSGKSTLVKGSLARYLDFDAKVVSIDYDSVTTYGEYCDVTNAVGGVNYQLKTSSSNILNLFELDVEVEYDMTTQREYYSLPLVEKVNDVTHIIMTMIKAGKGEADLATEAFLEDKISEAVSELFAERGIVDGEVDSLYTVGETVVGGRLGQGRVKKHLPTISDFYLKILRDQAHNQNDLFNKTYAIILSGMKSYVRELCYEVSTFKRVNPSFYKKLARDEKGAYEIIDGKKNYFGHVMGVRPYFDGESTIVLDSNTPMINFDISQLPLADKPVAQAVVMNYISERFIKKNSADPRKVQKRFVIIDEAHRGFDYPECRKFFEDSYRVSRKHHVSLWSITQALSDYERYVETMKMVDSTTCFFLFRQPEGDKEFLLDSTSLTELQVDELCSLGGDAITAGDDDSHRGEICLIDNGLPVFVKFDVLWTSEARYVTADAVSQKKILDSLVK